MRTIAIINQKGGCGKTTTAINLSGVFARRGLRTLLVDMDPQSHCAAGLAIPDERIEFDIGDAMLADGGARLDTDRLLWRVQRNLDLAPSRMRLAGMEAARGKLSELSHREHRLKGVLDRLAPAYGVCIIDCSPSIGLLAFNSIAAADAILIPVETSFFSLRGAQKQIASIRSLARRLGSELPYWILPTIYEPGDAHAVDLLGELRSAMPDRLCPTPIRRDATLKESVSFGRPVIDYAPESIGARDYTALAEWLGPMLALPMEDALPQMPDKHPEVVTSAEASEAFIQAPVAEAGSRTASGRVEDIARRAEALRRQLLGAGTRVTLEAATGSSAASVGPDTSVRRLLGVRAGSEKAVFVYPLSLGERIEIVGTFNDWQPGRHVLRINRELGVHELSVPLGAGRYSYRLVIDGVWRIDPYNEMKEPNPFGEVNSVLVVRSAAAEIQRAV